VNPSDRVHPSRPPPGRDAADDERRAQPGILTLWFGFLAGAVAWTIHLLASYALVGIACASSASWALYAVTLLTLLLTAAGGLAARRAWQASVPEQPNSTRGAATGFRRHMARWGVLMNLLFGLAILLEGLPVAFLSPCW
jgi:hypothetical protein